MSKRRQSHIEIEIDSRRARRKNYRNLIAEIVRRNDAEG
jgi:hypothetical protein